MFSRFITKRLLNIQSNQSFNDVKNRVDALSISLVLVSLGSILNSYAIFKIQDNANNK
jgi:hypothetical protein